MPNFKGSYLGRFPLVLFDFWTSDHLSERSRSTDAFSGTRARSELESLCSCPGAVWHVARRAPFARHDADGKKRAWFDELERRCRALADKEAAGTLSARDATHPAYGAYDRHGPPLPGCADVDSPERCARATKCGAYDPTPQHPKYARPAPADAQAQLVEAIRASKDAERRAPPRRASLGAAPSVAPVPAPVPAAPRPPKGLSLAGIFGVPQSPEDIQLKPKESAEIGEPTPSKDDDAAAAPVVSESSDIAEPTPRKEPAAAAEAAAPVVAEAPAAPEAAAPPSPLDRAALALDRAALALDAAAGGPTPAKAPSPAAVSFTPGFAEVVDTEEPEPVAEAPEVAEAPAAPEPEVAAAPAAALAVDVEAVGPTPAKAPSPAAVSFTPGFGDLGGAEPAEELPPAGVGAPTPRRYRAAAKAALSADVAPPTPYVATVKAVALPAPAAPAPAAPARKRASDAWWQKKVEAAAKSRGDAGRAAPAASGLAASLAEALKTPHPAEKRPAPRAAAAPAPVACDDPALAEFLAAATLTAYAAGVLTVAESIHDLEEMTDADVDDLAADIKLPKLKVRKFKAALAALRAAKAPASPAPEYI